MERRIVRLAIVLAWASTGQAAEPARKTFWSEKYGIECPLAEGWDLFGTRDRLVDEQLLSSTVLAWSRFALVLVGLGLLLAGAGDRLAARVGRAVVDAGWVVAGFTAAAGSLALWLLLGA